MNDFLAMAIAAAYFAVPIILFLWVCWRFYFDQRFWLIIGAITALRGVDRLLEFDGDYWRAGLDLVLGAVIGWLAWQRLVDRVPQPARRKYLTKMAALFGIKRRWLGLEPDFLLRRRCVAAAKGVRS